MQQLLLGKDKMTDEMNNDTPTTLLFWEGTATI